MSSPPDVDRGMVLVLGATGYVGGRLVPRLVEQGYAVRCLVRSPEKLRGMAWADDVEVVRGDLLHPASLGAAFAGVGTVLHLVHSMGAARPGTAEKPDAVPGSFSAADRQIATTVADAAAAADVRRIVYLSGLGDIDDRSSAHLRSRAEVGEILAAGPVPTTVLRAAVIIGSGSASFEMLRHLVEKLPVMVTPKWVHSRIQPIAIRDVLRYLVAVVELDDDRDHIFDLGGPDVLTYREMMQQYAEVAGLTRRIILPVPVLSPKLSSHWIGVVTPVPVGIAKPLVASLTQEVVVRPDGEDITAVAPGATIPYRRALRLALDRIRDHQVETSWRDAELADRSPAEPYPGDPAWAGGTMLSDVKAVVADCPAEYLYDTVCGIGGARGWPTHNWAWEARGWIDQLVGGVGLRRGRRDPDRLRVGDALDFWRVEDARPPRSDRSGAAAQGVLRLRAEMRLPGRAWLEFRITPGEVAAVDGAGATAEKQVGAAMPAADDDRTRAVLLGHAPPGPGQSLLLQRALFAPSGLAGRLYWWSMLPFHAFMFSAMVRTLARHAERLTSSDGLRRPREVRAAVVDRAPRGRRLDRSA